MFFRDIGDYSDFWDQISELYNNDGNGIIQIGKVDCKFNPETCQSQNINELLSLKYFPKEGSNFDHKPIADYLSNTIQEALESYFSEQTKSNRLQTGTHFVEFFIPYCRACRKISADWKELEENHADDKKVSVSSIDCRIYPAICDDFDIMKYPSLIWIENGDRIEKYNGYRALEAFEEYIEVMLESRPKVETTTTPAPRVKDERLIKNVSEEEFEDFIAKDFTFVKFYMRKCKYCKEVNDLWIELAERFHDHENITIAQVDCNRNYDLCMEDADGCPTANVYVNGVLMVRDYHEDLTLEGLSECIVSHMRGGEGEMSFLCKIKLFPNKIIFF